MAPKAESNPAALDSQTVPKRKKRRPISVYDAVAGRVGYEGFLTHPQASQYRDLASSSSIAVPPDEVLFRRKHAPVRYEEDDIYAAHRHLAPDQRLPDSDLLKAIHVYASDCFASTSGEKNGDHYQSLDETALLAMGILLEEAAGEALRTTGYRALFEEVQDAQR